MKKQYYIVTIQNVFENSERKDIVAYSKDGVLYDALLNKKIYMVNKNYYYFDKEQYLRENYSLIGIVIFKTTNKFYLNWLKKLKKEDLKRIIQTILLQEEAINNNLLKENIKILKRNDG